MDINLFAKNNSIIAIQTGSHLYGTNTTESDHDYMGIFIPPKEYFFGLKKVEQVNCGFEDKAISGKNTKDAIDFVINDIRKYFNLALGCNPNILELLFVNQENIINISKFGRELLNHKKDFLSVLAYDKFIGYAVAQKKRMIVKKENVSELKKLQSFLNNLDTLYDKAHICETFTFFHWDLKESEKGYHVGDIHIPKNIFTKRARKIINDRCNQFGNREELYLNYGYDTKFGAHWIRLLLQGIELLTTGNISYPLEKRDLILSIRNGSYSIKELLLIGEELETKLRSLKNVNCLPRKANIKEVEKLQIYLIENSLKEENKCQ